MITKRNKPGVPGFRFGLAHSGRIGLRGRYSTSTKQSGTGTDCVLSTGTGTGTGTQCYILDSVHILDITW